MVEFLDCCRLIGHKSQHHCRPKNFSIVNNHHIFILLKLYYTLISKTRHIFVSLHPAHTRAPPKHTLQLSIYNSPSCGLHALYLCRRHLIHILPDMLHIRHLCCLDILPRFSGSRPHFARNELKLVTLVLEEPVEGLGELVAGFKNLAPSEDVEPETCAGKSDSHAPDVTEISDTLCAYQREDNIYVSVSKLWG